ncbi:mCG147562 [Mus musculus]|nr:mCG147562 [Mus musculus]
MAAVADAHHRASPPGPRLRHGRRRIPPPAPHPARGASRPTPPQSAAERASKRAATEGRACVARPPKWAAHVTRWHRSPAPH